MGRIWVAVASLALIAGACKKSDTSKDTPAADTAGKVAETPADKATEMPVTTTSEQARAAFLKGQELVDWALWADARPRFREAIELDPDFATAHAYLAITGPAGENEAHWARALELAAKLPAAERLFITAGAAADRNDLAAAKKATEELLRVAADSWRAHEYASFFYSQANEMSAAEAELDKAIALAPKQAHLYNFLAYTKANLGKLDEALAAAKKQVQLAPDQPNPYDTLADIQMRAGRFAEAEASFKKAIEVNPGFHVPRSGIAAAQMYQGDSKAAIATLGEALELTKDPNERFTVRFDLVLAHALAGDHAGAMKLAGELVAAGNEAGFSGETSKYLARARLLMNQRQWREAHQAARAAVAALGDTATPGQKMFSHVVLVIGAARAGDKGGAETAFKALEPLAATGPFHDIALGHLAWVRGDLDAALAAFARTEGHPAVETLGLAAAAEILDAAGRADEAEGKRTRLLESHPFDFDPMLWRQYATETL